MLPRRVPARQLKKKENLINPKKEFKKKIKENRIGPILNTDPVLRRKLLAQSKSKKQPPITQAQLDAAIKQLRAQRKSSKPITLTRAQLDAAMKKLAEQRVAQRKAREKQVRQARDRVRQHIKQLRGQGVKGRARLRKLKETNPLYRELAK